MTEDHLDRDITMIKRIVVSSYPPFPTLSLRFLTFSLPLFPHDLFLIPYVAYAEPIEYLGIRMT